MPFLSMRQQILGLIGWLAVGFATAATGAIASVQAAQFYGQLTRPDWAPPAGVFGPVWSTLYVLMSVAAWLVWREGGWRVQAKPLALFLVQLLVNALWSWLFFAWHMGAAAFVDVCLLLLLIVATLVAFWRVRALAGVLMLPYLAWVAFATALCYKTWRLNPQLLG
ncbi:sensory protein [Bordetella genomosp. 9]|uniref:Sensory protein n=1 Tax=Bordetella genomosp. 9 TaxID=1416803 RepID=A0A261RNL2_9BORD|nr:TspO/MBR family protein [Bordetella genomosp. 9]OZI26491.1 sensory protein [Bordetella genomosp. 9]